MLLTVVVDVVVLFSIVRHSYYGGSNGLTVVVADEDVVVCVKVCFSNL